MLCKLLPHLLRNWLKNWNMSSPSILDVQDTNFMLSNPSLALELSEMVFIVIAGA